MIYIWHKEQVISGLWGQPELKRQFNYHFMYDPDDQDPWGQANHGVWSHREPNEVPKEFKLALLILGVLK